MKLLASICFILMLPILASATPVEFTKEYTYDAGETDSLISCRTTSLIEVKRLLLEELGTYLESNTEIENYHLKKDQITILTGGIVKTEVLKEEWNGHTYWLMARIKADPEQVIDTIDKLHRNNGLEDKIRKLTEQYSEAYDKIEELTDSLSEAQQNLFLLNKNYKDVQNKISASNLLEQGKQLRKENKNNDALDSFSAGIKIHSTYNLYVERGKTYIKIGHFKEAIDDFNIAIKISPNYAKAYFYKGIALIKKGNKRKGVKFINKSADMGNQTAKLWLKTKDNTY